MPETPVFELANVAMRFGRQAVLRGISLSLKPGETLVVVGESGCGKTVLLKLIVGLLQPTEGSVQFEGKSLGSLREAALIKLRLRVGYLFQGGALFDSLNVFDNVAFGLRALGKISEQQVREKVDQRLIDVGLTPSVGAKMPSELSGGMKKRVGLARALALEPELMLYDEPTTGLDPIMSDVINELILQTRRTRPISSVVVTHDLRTVQKVADRVIMLYPIARLGSTEPQILFDGSPGDLEKSSDPRVLQFVRGEAGDRVLSAANN